MKKVLFITSYTEDIRELFYKARSEWKVSRVDDLHAAPSAIVPGKYDFILFDLGLKGLYAPDLLDRITSVPMHPPVFIISREYCFSFFNLSRKAGVCGYFQIPFTLSLLIGKINRFFEAAVFSQDNKEGFAVNDQPDAILGKSIQMQLLRKEILKFQKSTEPLMIYGETGTGKDLVARMIHSYSPVSSGPYTVQNVSCIPPTLAESVLFGTTRGSYTGAVDSKGLFEESDQGTLFLDEIGELSPSIQPKFLRVLEDKQVSRIGSSKSIKVNFRLICATNRLLGESIKTKDFREDLFHRLDVLRLVTPPLREHIEDIPLLCSFRLRGQEKVFSDNALDKLCGYEWPGNVRQLFNCVARAACDSSDEIIHPEQIQF